jgi:CubicO group peptidase (beta-lactamase class C family)
MKLNPVFCIVIFLSLSLITQNTMAQSLQQQKTDSVFQQVKKYFNAKQADSIYAVAGESFKKNLDAITFSDFVNQRLFPLGEIKQSTLISFVNNKIATYKLEFATLKLQLLMSLDDNGKLDYFLFQPYKEPEGNKPTPVATTNPMKSAVDKKVDSAARPYIQKANTVGLSIGILRNGKSTVYNYGETARGNGKLPNANNLFEIGSITKTFTAAILAYYVNEGKVGLDDRITKYLPDSVDVNPLLNSITLKMLSNHTSGLPRLPDNMGPNVADALNPYKDYTKNMLYTYLQTCKLNSVPGEQYTYSNLGVGLLGAILEQLSGQTFEQMVTEIITKPLGMGSTIQYLTPAIAPRFVTVYNEDGRETPAWDCAVLAPCVALKSSVHDLLLYANANMLNGKSKLSKAFALTHKITYNKDIKLGLAWHIITVNGVDYYFHNGGTYGSSSYLAFNIERRIAVIVLSNCGESVDNVAIDILRKLQ